MQYPEKKNGIVVILGPTASGKTALSLRLAKKFNGEIISADSRQVYRGLDIGSGKTPRDTFDNLHLTSDPNSKRSRVKSHGSNVYLSEGITHHLIDVASPKRIFTVTQFQKLATKAIEKIVAKGKLPIICGGTGHYIDAVVNGTQFPDVRPNRALRKKLERMKVNELFAMLAEKDPRRAGSIDRRNPRRLIRALEIVLATGKPVPTTGPGLENDPSGTGNNRILWIGLNPPMDVLHKYIHARLLARFKEGMVAEVRRLKKSGVTSNRMESFGLEYRYINRYLEHKITRTAMLQALEREIREFAKRQMTWFKRNAKVQWVGNNKKAEKLVREFLSNAKFDR